MKFTVPDVKKFYEGVKEVEVSTKGAFGQGLLVVATGGLVTVTGYGDGTYAKYVQNADVATDGTCVIATMKTLNALTGEANFKIVKNRLKVTTNGYITLPITSDDPGLWDFDMPQEQTYFSAGGIKALTHIQRDDTGAKVVWDNVFVWDGLAFCVNSNAIAFATQPSEYDGDIVPIHLSFVDKLTRDTMISASGDSVWGVRDVGDGVLTMKYSTTEINAVAQMLNNLKFMHNKAILVSNGKVTGHYCKVQKSDIVNALLLARAQWTQWSETKVGLVWIESTEDGLNVKLVDKGSEMDRTIDSTFGGEPFGAVFHLQKTLQCAQALQGGEITLYGGWNSGMPLSFTDGVSSHMIFHSESPEIKMYPERGAFNVDT